MQKFPENASWIIENNFKENYIRNEEPRTGGVYIFIIHHTLQYSSVLSSCIWTAIMNPLVAGSRARHPRWGGRGSNLWHAPPPQGRPARRTAIYVPPPRQANKRPPARWRIGWRHTHEAAKPRCCGQTGVIDIIFLVFHAEVSKLLPWLFLTTGKKMPNIPISCSTFSAVSSVSDFKTHEWPGCSRPFSSKTLLGVQKWWALAERV